MSDTSSAELHFRVSTSFHIFQAALLTSGIFFGFIYYALWSLLMNDGDSLDQSIIVFHDYIVYALTSALLLLFVAMEFFRLVAHQVARAYSILIPDSLFRGLALIFYGSSMVCMLGALGLALWARGYPLCASASIIVGSGSWLFTMIMVIRMHWKGSFVVDVGSS